MTVKAKKTRSVEDMISRGGKSIQESSYLDFENKKHRLTLRIPQDILRMIRKDCQERTIKITTTQWLLEAIVNNLKNKTE